MTASLHRPAWRHAVAVVATVAVGLTACTAPAATPSGGQTQPSAAAPSAPKVLQIAFREEPTAIHGGSSGTPEREIGELLNASLTTWDATGNLIPRLATKLPSVSDGDWVVAADGTMELTWKLKPNLVWHDGTPLTAEDFAFGWRVFKDKDWTASIPSAVGFISEATAKDPSTLVLKFSRVNNAGAVTTTSEFPPLPRHKLESTYTSLGAGAVGNSPVLTTEWVGLGAYKMSGRTLGSRIEGEAFDQYVFGRPKIDRIALRWLFDGNALVANLLSGEIDIVPNNMEAAQAATLKQQWEAQGKGTVQPNPTRTRQIQLQYRDPSAPWASDPRVRQGMLHLLDRQALVDAVVSGLTTVAHSALLPADPAYAALQKLGLPMYPYDRARGEALLDQAGWTRGSDGIRRNASGTIFRYNHANVGESDQDETLVIVDAMKAGGIASDPNIIPETAADANEQRAKANGVARPAVADATYWERFETSTISSDANRWRGANTGGYSNPEVDRLITQWRGTLDPAQVVERTAQIHKLLLDEMVNPPLYYQVEIFAYRKGLNGPGPFSPRGRNALMDIQTWTIS
jgi:peptide/nickel transport system substrate-binding protein